jgi:hypothetical protein
MPDEKYRKSQTSNNPRHADLGTTAGNKIEDSSSFSFSFCGLDGGLKFDSGASGSDGAVGVSELTEDRTVRCRVRVLVIDEATDDDEVPVSSSTN